MATQTIEKQHDKRRRYFVDSDVQSALLKQLVLNWTVVFTLIASVLLAVESFKVGFTLGFWGSLQAIWHANAVLLVTLVALLPFVIYESIRLSHRFAGPMTRFRAELKRMGAGENVEPIQFRRDDFWKDIAESFNSVRQRIEELEQSVPENDAEAVTAELAG